MPLTLRLKSVLRNFVIRDNKSVILSVSPENTQTIRRQSVVYGERLRRRLDYFKRIKLNSAFLCEEALSGSLTGWACNMLTCQQKPLLYKQKT